VNEQRPDEPAARLHAHLLEAIEGSFQGSGYAPTPRLARAAFAAASAALYRDGGFIERLADVLHGEVCGPFTTIDPQKCLAGRDRDVRLAQTVAAALADANGGQLEHGEPK
jgi:hypothetical protein